MEKQSANHLFPVFNNKEFYPSVLARILGVFYTSNQKYFTVEELKSITNFKEAEIQNALIFFNQLGEITKEKNNLYDQEYFFFDVEGAIKNLKKSVADNKKVLNILERIIEKRDTSNEILNDFIKSIIVIYSEVLDFTTVKINEHFNK